MTNKEQKKKDNERLIGKTVKWIFCQNELSGKVVGVKDHETVIVVADGISYDVDLFDIVSTK